MKRNVSGQVVGAQMVSATDGSAFTGSVTVHVTGDGGTQATGSVGSGACTHEGNGFHTYAPAQAETNYDHVAFTFTGTGAIPVTVQVYTTFPQTGDSYARLGAPAGASVSADIAEIEGRIPDALVNGRIDATVDGAGMEAGAIAVIADGVWDEARSGHTTAGTFGQGVASVQGNVTGSVASVTGAVGSVTGNVGGNVTGSVGSLGTQAKADVNAEVDTAISDAALATAASLATVDSNVDAIKAVTDNLPDSGALTSLATAASIAALNDISAADVNAQVADVIKTDTIPELTADPGATPTLEQAVMLFYMAIRNRRDTTATSDEIMNNAGTTILTATLSDDGTTFSKTKYG